MMDEGADQTGGAGDGTSPLDDALTAIEAAVSAERPKPIAPAPRLSADKESERPSRPRRAGKRRRCGEDGEGPRPRQRGSLLDIGGDLDLWRDSQGDGYVSFDNVDGVRDHAPIMSRAFGQQLALRYLRAYGEVPSSSALDDCLRIFAAQALTAPIHEPILRIGEGPSGIIVIDRCTPDGSYISVSKYGFETRLDARPKFIRRRGMTALCDPEPGSSIALLRPFINASDDNFALIVAWLLQGLRPSGPFPIAVFSAEQGSGKSIISTLLRRLTDPSAVQTAAPPRDVRDLLVAAINSRVLAFDNVSKLDNELSDALCRLSTGGGARARALHTNTDEVLFMGARPIIINGIGTLAERADLSDRTLVVSLATIDEHRRRSEHDFWREFELVEPAILGALLTAVSSGLRNFETTRLDRAPRLADFARWIVACEPGLGDDWEPGTFLRAYAANRMDARESAFESDIVAMAIDRFIRSDRPEGWHGTATELLGVINGRTSDEVKRRRDWPYSAQGLGNRLDRAAPLLRARGFTIERRHGAQRTITITMKETADA